MFPDIGGSELIIVAIVALLVVKPKDLPKMMRKFGEIMGKARRMANDFRASFEDMARQSELDDLRKEVEAMRAKSVDPLGLNSVIAETDNEIRARLATPTEPDYAFQYEAPDEIDNSIPWEGSGEASAPVADVLAEKPVKAPKTKAPTKVQAQAEAPAKTPATAKPAKATKPKTAAKAAKPAAGKPTTKRAT